MQTNIRVIIAHLIILIIFSQLIVNCAMKNHHITAAVTEYTNTTNADNIKIFNANLHSGGPDPHIILGKVHLKRNGKIKNNGDREKLAKDVRKIAATIGADAITGYYTSNYGDNDKENSKIWASGLAIKYDKNVSQLKKRLNFSVSVVANPQLEFEDWRELMNENLKNKVEEFESSSNRGKHSSSTFDPNHEFTRKEFEEVKRQLKKSNEDVFRATQYQLEKKGYYALFYKAKGSRITPEYLTALSDSVLDTLAGSQTEMLLLVELVSVGGFNAIQFATAESIIRAQLFSKSKKRVVWENTGSGVSFKQGWLLVAVQGNDKRTTSAVCKAVKNTFKTLLPFE